MSDLSLLIVEDEKKTAEKIVSWAKECGFEDERVAVAAHPEDAKEKWRAAGGFDAIVLDLKMEGDERSGFQLLKELRTGRNRPRRVFIYSGHLDDLLMPCEAVQSDVVSFHLKSGGEASLCEHLEAFVTANSISSSANVNYDAPGWRELKALLPHLARSELPVSSDEAHAQITHALRPAGNVQMGKGRRGNCYTT